MSYWHNKSASASNVRHYTRGEGWRAYDDTKNDKGEIAERGSSRLVEEALTSALNASNLVLLTGAGSSFCAKNTGANIKQAPGMNDLWDAVVLATTQDTMNKIIALMPLSQPIVAEKNIEKFLTHCKIYLELFGPEKAKDVSDFITLAEKAIATRVDFVSDATDLSAHQSVVRKIARRSVRKPRARIHRAKAAAVRRGVVSLVMV